MGLGLGGAGPVALGDLVLFRADFRGAIFNSSVAGIAGIAFALAWTLVVRPFGTQVATRRLVCGGWGDVGENAMGTRTHPQLRARMLDRLALRRSLMPGKISIYGIFIPESEPPLAQTAFRGPACGGLCIDSSSAR